MPKRKTGKKRGHKEFQELFDALEQQIERERTAFRETVESLRNSAPILRAEGCLRFWAERLEEWGDHEAVIYLASRGHDCTSITRTILANWREAEKDSISRMGGIKDPHALKENPAKVLHRFWNSFDSQELSIDATMLRTVEWCNIRGFDQWWQNLGTEILEGAFSGGAHPFAIFNYCRADYAVCSMGDGLKLSLDAVETLAFPKSAPWWRNDGNLECAIHDAAAIIFAHARLGSAADSAPLVERATDDLRKFFNHRVGAWPAFSGRPEKLSIETTAMALHALRLRRVDDWEHFATAAHTWLWAQQHPDGYWFENAAPDPVWLTVLVLDAIELTSGGTNVTFRLVPMSDAPLVFVAYQHDDIQWLEDLKKHLGGLIHGGRIEFFDDRQIGGGKEWDPHIKKKLMDAKIIVPLISPNFLGSKYIQTVEFPTAIARHREGSVSVMPVLVEECDWESLRSNGVSLAQINLLPKDAKNKLKPVRAWGRKKHEALAQVAAEIRKGTSNNTSFGRFLPWLSGRLQRSCQGGSSIGTALTPDGRPSVLLHDATRTPPVSALRPAQPSAARAEPAGECCNRGSSSRS